MVRLYAFKMVPTFAQGLVRDLRVRWALEEAGIPYETHLLDRAKNEGDADWYRRLQPFGQVPAYEEEGLKLFESGAILLHIAGKSPKLFPKDLTGKERATSWVFAALTSIEPYLTPLMQTDIFYADEEWAKLRRPSAMEAARGRLANLSKWLEGKDYLEGEFTAGDLMMTTVLRIARHTSLLDEFPILSEYQKRCETRPAFQRALDAQMAPFTSGGVQ